MIADTGYMIGKYSDSEDDDDLQQLPSISNCVIVGNDLDRLMDLAHSITMGEDGCDCRREKKISRNSPGGRGFSQDSKEGGGPMLFLAPGSSISIRGTQGKETFTMFLKNPSYPLSQ